MGIAVKVLIGLVLLLPMTAYVVGSLVAAAVPPPSHDPIIVQEHKPAPEKPKQSPSDKPTEKPRHHKHDDHGTGDDDHTEPPIVTSSPEVFDDHGGGESSGKGSGDDSSGKGSGHG